MLTGDLLEPMGRLWLRIGVHIYHCHSVFHLFFSKLWFGLFNYDEIWNLILTKDKPDAAKWVFQIKILGMSHCRIVQKGSGLDDTEVTELWSGLGYREGEMAFGMTSDRETRRPYLNAPRHSIERRLFTTDNAPRYAYTGRHCLLGCYGNKRMVSPPRPQPY